MTNLNELLATANNAQSNVEFLTASIPLVAYDVVNNGESYSDIETALTFVLSKSEDEADGDLLNTFLSKFDVFEDMSYNDTESMTECKTSRVYKEWLARDKSLPKLSYYAKRVEGYLIENGVSL